MPSRRLASALALLLLAVPASAAVLTVDQSGGGDYTTIQDAVDAAVDGDVIEVSAGQYTASSGGDLEVVSVVNKSVTIQAVVGELVVIYGEAIRRGMSCTLSNDHVMLDGLVFYLCETEDDGGGLEVTGSSGSVTITNCTFDACYADGVGGGMSIRGVDATLTDCSISQCDATSGGGVCLDAVSASPSWTVTTCEVWDCWALFDTGGALSVSGGLLDSNSCTWDANDADGDGGAWHVTGGAVVTADGDTFSDNVSEYEGGAIKVESGSTVTLTTCTLHNNTAEDGGAASVAGSLVMVDSNADTCTASATGGGFSVRSTGLLDMTDCTVKWSTAPTGNDIAAASGGVVTLTGCVFQGNGLLAGSSVDAPSATLDCDTTTMCDYAADAHINGAWTDSGGNLMGQWCCQGEVNADNSVGTADLTTFLGRWGDQTVVSNDREDVDRDGVVSVMDLLDLLLNWGVCEIAGPV